jgi:transcriptional regulator with XRE-family HTH domain
LTSFSTLFTRANLFTEWPARLVRSGRISKKPKLGLGFVFQRWSAGMPKSPDPTDKHVGNRVRIRRLMLGVSQTKLADALGITFQQVQKYEKGANRISASKLQHISRFLQAPIPFFFEGLPGASDKPAKNDDTIVPSDIFQSLASTEGLSLVKSFTRIKRPQLRRCIVSLVDGLATKEAR